MRSAMRAASQLLGRGPLMWMMLLHVNQKSNYDMIYDYLATANCQLLVKI